MTDNTFQDTTTLTLSCACHAISGSVNVPSSNLPLPMVLCHCNTCRHTTGLLCASDIFIPPGSSLLQIQGEPRSYSASSHLIRYFCGHCGCFIYDENLITGKLGICTGSLEMSDGLVELMQHDFVGDTIDGGLSDWLQDAVRWKGSPNKSDQIEKGTKAFAIDSQRCLGQSTHLQAHCKCGGVKFYITPPDESSKKPSPPWSDNLVPYHLGSSDNPDDVKWWLRSKGTRFLAATCARNSCRLGSGYDFQAWAFIPKANIFQAHGEVLDFGAGTLKRYESSKGACRDFCHTCGATVFWSSDARPELIDVSVGLLNAESGARAEEWLDWWTERVSFEEMALNKSLISQLSKGLQEWGKGRRERTT